MFTPSDCTDIRIIKFDFVAKAKVLYLCAGILNDKSAFSRHTVVFEK